MKKIVTSQSPEFESGKDEQNPHQRIVAALMRLLAQTPWQDISISQISQEANVSLSQFRGLFPSKGAILASYLRSIDMEVLQRDFSGLVDESPKERLFDILMARLEAMTPQRAALRSIVQWVKRDPIALASLNQAMINSMRFMLEAVDIDSEGTLGNLKLQGLVIAFSRVTSIWLDEEDGNYPRTMAALIRELDRGDFLVARANDVNRIFSPMTKIFRSRSDADQTASKSAEDKEKSEPSEFKQP